MDTVSIDCPPSVFPPGFYLWQAPNPKRCFQVIWMKKKSVWFRIANGVWVLYCSMFGSVISSPSWQYMHYFVSSVILLPSEWTYIYHVFKKIKTLVSVLEIWQGVHKFVISLNLFNSMFSNLFIFGSVISYQLKAKILINN